MKNPSAHRAYPLGLLFRGLRPRSRSGKVGLCPRSALACGIAVQATALFLTATVARATQYTKADNTTTLTSAASYTANSGNPTSKTDSILFDSTLSAANAASNSINTGVLTVGLLTFANSLNGPVLLYVNSTNTVTLGGTAGDIIDMSAANQDVTINGTTGTLRLGTLTGQQNFDVASGRTLTLNVANLISQGNSDYLGLVGAGNIVINSTVDGSNPLGLNINGANATLTASNLWTPNTSTTFALTSGTLNFGNNNAVQTATGNTKAFGINGGTISASGAARTVVTNGGFSFGGDFAVSGTNSLTIGSATTETVSRIITNNMTGTGVFTLGGNFDLTNSGTTNRTLTLTGAGLSAVSGILSNGTSTGVGSVTYSGTSTLSLSAANTFSGTLTASSGAIVFNNALAAQNATVSIGVANGVTFGTGITSATIAALSGSSNEALTNSDGNAVALTVGNNNVGGTYGGVLTGLGALTKTGTATQVLSVGGQTYSGTTNISGGILQTGGSGNTASNLFGAGAINLSGGGEARFNSTSGATVNSDLVIGTGGGTLSFRGNSIYAPNSITGTGALGLDIDNGETLTPNTFNGFGGTVNVSTTGTAATLRLGGTFDNASLGSAQLNLGAGISLTRNAGTNGTTTVTNIGTLSGVAGSSIGGSTAGTGVYTFSVGSRNEDSTFAGTIVDGGTKTALTKTGTGTMTLTGANTFTGTTTISGGTLAASAASALGGTATLAVNNGGTLLLSGTGTTDRVNNAAAIQLNGGTINTNGSQEGSSSAVGVGALTLQSSSIVNLSGTSLLHFAASGASSFTGTLSIYNWNGSSTGGGAEQILFGTDDTAASLTTAELAQITFYSDSGTTSLGTAQFAGLGDGEIVPSLAAVPEPATWFTGLLCVSAFGYALRRRGMDLVRVVRGV